MRLLSIIVLLLHLSTLNGLRLHVHYCGGEAESITLSDAAVDCCCAPSVVPDNCCRDEVVVMQASDDAFAQSSVLHFPAFAAILTRPLHSQRMQLGKPLETRAWATYRFADLPPPDVLAMLQLRRI